MMAPCVCFVWSVEPHDTVCTVCTTVCTMCSTTHPCSRNGSLMTMEVKGEKEKLIKKIVGLEAHKNVGQAGINQRGYVGGLHGTMSVGSWCCSRPS